MSERRAKATDIVYDYRKETQIREMARLREKALHDEVSSLKSARNEGIQEGIDTMIESMRELGISEDLIQEVLDERNKL
jgi:DNA-binding transcriptional regulator YhcF (GntR family)